SSAGEARLPILEEPAFTGLAQQTAEGEGGHTEAASAAALRAMSPAQRRPALEAELKRLAGSVLNQPPTTIDLGRPLADIGFDSLMAVDLRLAAEGALGISLPLGGLGDGVSLSDLAREMDKAMAAESQDLETVADLATGNDRHLRNWATPPTAKPVPDARHREVAADAARPTAPVEPRQRASAPARHQARAEDRDLETLLGSHAAALSTDARASLAKALSRPDQTPTRGQNQHQRERHG
ncbi:MAG: acyl carrier protein, partial [Pseudomonadota bacterium]